MPLVLISLALGSKPGGQFPFLLLAYLICHQSLTSRLPHVCSLNALSGVGLLADRIFGFFVFVVFLNKLALNLPVSLNFL